MRLLPILVVHTTRDRRAAGGGYHGAGTYSWAGAAGTWFWIDPVYKLVLVGMTQHRGDGTPEVGALSRSWVYQAITESSRSD